MVVSSGLVSLNIHEALTFEGTEICLHPDLFSSTVSGVGASNSNDVGGLPPPLPLTSNRTLSLDGKAGCLNPPPLMNSGSSFAGSAQTNTINNTAIGKNANPNANIRNVLKPGDMIEIRVWDPINGRSSGGGFTGSSNASSIIRPRATAIPSIFNSTQSLSNATQVHPLHSSSSSSIQNNPNVVENQTTGVQSTSTEIAENKVSSRDRALSSATNNSLQYSDKSDTDDFQEQTADLMHHAIQSAPSKDSLITNATASSQDFMSLTSGRSNPVPLPIKSDPGSQSLQSMPSTPIGSPVHNAKTIDASILIDLPTLKVDGAPTTAGSSILPPVFPRSRTNTGDNQTFLGLTSRLVSKRPGPVQRRSTLNVTNTSTEPSANNIILSKQRSTAAALVPAISATPKVSRHYRDLSDMTAETLSGPTVASLTQNASSSVDVDHSPGGGSNLENRTSLVTTSGLAVSPTDDEDDGMSHLSNTHTLRLSFVMIVTEKSFTSLKGAARTQVSILRQVADLYHLSSYDMLTITKVDKSEEAAVLSAVSADFIVVTIKDQFISRGDMHYFQNSLMGSWLYEGQRLLEPTRGFQAIARAIRHTEQMVRSGVITDKTTVTFRSRSARILWIVQMSAEMWDYASPYERGKDEGLCEIYFDKWISFIHGLFAKWKEVEATHSLTVVFFSRTYLNANEIWPKTKRDAYGRCYEDHYRPVIENAMRLDWDSVVRSLKEVFVNYPKEVGWNLSTDETSRRPSSASQGNVLEAINVTLNLLQFHYLDRDLHRTGNSIVLISAGNGVFEVDQGLAGVTYQRMMDNGIGSDMLSLSLPALHIAPFFLYNNVNHVNNLDSMDAQEQYFEVPHWMHLSFVSYESDETVFATYRDEEAKDDEDDNPLLQRFTGVEIRANGFLLPRTVGPGCERETPSSPLLRSSAMVSNGIAPTSIVQTPVPVSSERQLIAGRDFRDILEACRPRHAGVIPSPLKALLEVHYHGLVQREIEIMKHDDVMDGHNEWGACDFYSLTDDDGVPVSLSEEPRELPTAQPLGGGGNGNLLSSSVHRRPDGPSSLASHVSSSILGSSYDRPYLTDHTRSHAGFQLQAPAYLDYSLIEDEDCDSDVEVSDDNSSDDESGTRRRRQVHTSFEEKLRKMMEAHDSMIAPLSTPSVIPKSEPSSLHWNSRNLRDHDRGPDARGSLIEPATHKSRLKNAQVHASGGIGAALLQHRNNVGPVIVSVETDVVPSSNSRIPSGRLNLTPTFRHMSEVGSRGLSPSLFPPPASIAVNPNVLRDGRLPLERRLIDSRASSSSAATNWKPRKHTGILAGSRIQHTSSEAKSQGNYISSARSFSLSPPTDRGRGNESSRMKTAIRQQPASVGGKSRHNKKAFNPFRQKDEEEVLAKKSHNRRRWSHVFPLGEIEFKRHAGPNWRSLSAPAILPLFIDYFPSQDEIDKHFTFSIYNVTLSEFDRKNYTSNKDLLMEMVRQRITQDFQLVSEDNVNASNYRPETLRDGLANRSGTGTVAKDTSKDTHRQFLSMGHRLQVLTYDATSDVIEVTRYTAKNAQQNNSLNTFKYHYCTYCQETRSYSSAVQTFEKYADQYNWNKFDRIICGDEDRELREGMRFRRLMFGIIPDEFNDAGGENDYISKFRRLLEYLNKLREKDECQTPLDIKFVTKYNKSTKDINDRMESTPGIAHNSMQRFYVQLRKGVRDAMEWIEVVVDSTFNTSWSYRIIFNWLVASSGKVDAQIQLLQRRCVQFGLNLVPFPQITVSRTLYLNPFKAPAIFRIRLRNANALDSALAAIDFIHDGVFYTDVKAILECIENGDEFNLPSVGVAGRQVVHRSGTLFVRIFTDRNGLTLLVVLGNYRYLETCTKEDKTLENAYRKAFSELVKCVDTL